MKMRVLALLLAALMLTACAGPAANQTSDPSNIAPSSTTPTQGGEETVDYFRALYPVDGQIPDKKGISDIVKEMGRGLGKITEIDYTFKNGKVTMNV